MKKNTEKLEYISALKNCTMILVVLYHCLLVFTNNWFTPVNKEVQINWCSKLAEIINLFIMPVFIFCSGYLFYYLRYKKGKYRTPSKDIKKRFNRLIVPYIFTSILWVIPISYIFYKWDIIKIIDKFVLGRQPSQLWFLLALFWIYIFFYYMSDRLKTNNITLCIMILGTVALNYFLNKIQFNFWQINLAVQYSLYFYFGGYVLKNERKFKTEMKSIIYIIIFILSLTCLGYIISKHNNEIAKIANIYLKVLIQMSIVYMLYIIFKVKKESKILNYINKINEYSFGIYLFHQQIIYILTFYMFGRLNVALEIFLTFAISIILAYIIQKILKKNKITKFIFGI